MPYFCNSLLILFWKMVSKNLDGVLLILIRKLPEPEALVIYRVFVLLTLLLMLHSSRLLVACSSVPVFRTVIDLIEAGAADFGDIDIRRVSSWLFATTQPLAMAAVYF